MKISENISSDMIESKIRQSQNHISLKQQPFSKNDKITKLLGFLSSLQKSLFKNYVMKIVKITIGQI